MSSTNLISLIIPTRKRTKSLRRLFNSIQETCKDTDNLEVVLAIDDDDIETIRFVKEYAIDTGLQIRPIISDRGKGYADLHNKIKNLCTVSEGQILLFLGDDSQFMTNNWDEIILATYNNVYADNIYWINTSHGEEDNPYPLFFAITRDWFNITGHMGTCCAQDTEFTCVAKHVNREIFLNNILIIHHRADPKTGIIDGELDKTHLEGRMAVDSGSLATLSLRSTVVQTNIVIDAIKLLKRIKALQRKGDNTEISAKIQALHWSYVILKLQRFVPSGILTLLVSIVPSRLKIMIKRAI